MASPAPMIARPATTRANAPISRVKIRKITTPTPRRLTPI